MKEIIVNENCIGCGACVATSPECLEFNDEGLATAKFTEVPTELVESAQEAQMVCPVDAIQIN